MTASLLVAGLEMIGSATNPEYRLAPGLDFGEGEPDQATIVSLYLDGEVIQGKRTHNRQMQLPILVRTSNSLSLTANVDTLLQKVCQETFQVQWTPDGGLPVIFDAYRATVQRPRDLTQEAQGFTALILTFAAKPFGRTPTAATPSLTAGTATTHGKPFSLASIVGSVRTPVNLALTTGGSFTQFLLHTPPANQDSAAQILSSLSTSTNPQNVTIAAANANLRGTFSIVLGGATDGTAGTIQVTVTQKENGTQVGDPWVSPQVTHDITTQGLLFVIGEVTLPLYDTPSDNTLTSYLINVNISAGTDRYSELMLCDTTGQTILTDTAAASSGVVVYVDEPSPLQSGPSVYISSVDRTTAWGKLGDCVVSGGPILFEPGANKILAWTDSGTPAVALSYYPRWLDERVS